MKRLNIPKGEKYGKLQIIEEIGTKKIGNSPKRIFLVKCDCGKTINVILSCLISGNTKSCGCSRTLKDNTKSSIYSVYHAIKQRCENPKSKSFWHYGGRGIKNEWSSFKEFRKDMEDSYQKGLSIDRIDNNGNYCKENCRWTTPHVQLRNRRNNVVYKGICAADASILLGGTKCLIARRLVDGWSVERAFTTKVK